MSERLNSMSAMLESLSRQKQEIETELASCTDDGKKAELSAKLVEICRRMTGGIPSSGLKR